MVGFAMNALKEAYYGKHSGNLIGLARGNLGVQAGEEARPLFGCGHTRR